MGNLKVEKGLAYEMITGVLDEPQWWAVLRVFIEFLKSKTKLPIDIKYGFVIDRDVAGKEQGKDGTINVDSIESVVRDGLRDGTIERSGMSDFIISLQSPAFAIMLCNDADIHFAASDLEILNEAKDVVARTGSIVHGPN